MASTPFLQQDPEQTLSRIEHYLARDPDNPDLRANAIDLNLALGNLLAARAHAEEAIARYPQDSFFLHRHGNVLLAERRLDEAETVFRQLLEREDYAGIAYNLAYVLYQQGRFAEACGVMAPRTAQDDAATEAMLLHARSLHQLGEIRRAQDIVVRGLERQGDHVELLALAGLLHFDNDEMNEAEAYSAAAVAAADDCAIPLEALIVRGWVLLAQENAPAALADFGCVLAACPGETRSLTGSALACILNKDDRGAAEAIRLILEKDADNISAATVQSLIDTDQADRANAFRAMLNRYGITGSCHSGSDAGPDDE